MKTKFSIIFFLCYSIFCCGQIVILNSSFEGELGATSTPEGWSPIGIGSTPDTQPGSWDVEISPKQGDSYIGIVMRKDGYNEGIFQELSLPLEKDICYNFEISLSSSKQYAKHNHRNPKLIVLGINDLKFFNNERENISTEVENKYEILAESAAISKEEWMTYKITFTPKFNYKFIALRVGLDINEFGDGNLLIDNMTNISKCETNIKEN